MKKFAILLLITAVYLAGTFIVPEAAEAGITQVDTISAKKEAVELSVTVTGKVEEKSRNEIKSDLILCVKSVCVKPGDKVKAGEILFYVDVDSSFQAIIEKTGAAAENIPEIPAEIKAESDGTIGEVNVKENGVYMPDTALITVVNSSELQVRSYISEDVISRVSVGMKTEITGSGFKGRTYQGKILQIYPTAQNQIGGVASITTVEVVVSIEKADKYLKPGFTAKVKIITDSGDSGIIVPYEVVRQDAENKEYVYVSNGYEAKVRYIKTGRETEKGIEIVDGIKEGDMLVANPEAITDEDSSVRIKTIPATAGGSDD